MRSRSVTCLALVVALGFGVAACAEETFNPAIAAGADGVTVIDGKRSTPIKGMSGIDFLLPGALAAPLSDSAVVVIGQGQIGRIDGDGRSIITECTDCRGVAATDEFVVTTRKNFQPGEGFDIILLSHSLEPERAIPARRLSERSTIDYPPENTESPVTLAAAEDRVTVGYLSANGGVRAGPSVIAQYSYDGELLDSEYVDGILGQAAASPDGQFLAVGVGGSGGACITESAPQVLALDGLDPVDVGPFVPDEAAVGYRGPEAPWFLITDLYWQDHVVRVTGEVHGFASGPSAGGGSEVCEGYAEPEVWTRTVDVETNEVLDLRRATALATRWIGPECGDVIEVDGSAQPNVALVSRVKGEESVLGSYTRVALGNQSPGEC